MKAQFTDKNAVSTSVTYGKTVQQDSKDINDKDYWRWVYFPKWLETCGVASRYDFAPGIPNPNGGMSTPTCGKNVEETVEDTCAFSPEIDPKTNQPIVFWAVRKYSLALILSSFPVITIRQRHGTRRVVLLIQMIATVA